MSRSTAEKIADPSTRSQTSLLDGIGIGVLLVDGAGDVIVSNAIADELVSRRVNDSPLMSVLVELAKSAFDAEHSCIDPAVLQGRAPACELAGQRRVEAYDAHGRMSVIGYRFVQSPRLGMIFTLRDITEAEKLRAEKRQLARLSQVGRACAMVAHELGNPLAAIKATIQSIEQDAARVGLQDPIAAVYSEIDRLDKILSELRGFVRHRLPRKQKASIVAIVEQAKISAGPKLGHVRFEAHYGRLEPVHVDPDQMGQVLLNLFVNAADAMPDGGTLSVFAEVLDGQLSILVDDDGVGIQREIREHIFEAFFTTKQAGTGLGLSICYRIVSEHGGTIAVEQRPVKGTRVIVTLPNTV